MVEIHVKQPGIPPRLPEEDESDDQEYGIGHPYAGDHADVAPLGEFFPLDGKHVEDDEEQDGDQEGHAQPAFLNDGAEGSADQEHRNTGEGTGDDLVPLDSEYDQLGLISFDLGVVG